VALTPWELNFMPIFKNPNDPRQPKAGVYGWFFEHQGKTHCVYIGQAGMPASHTERCTLFRGISQLARITFSSDGKGEKLDTDFVVGCAIRYVENVFGVECFWEHLSDDPANEKAICRERRPLIQALDTIHPDLKCFSKDCAWNLTKKTGRTLEQRLEVVVRAEAEVFKGLSKYIALPK
jgi:hypothetical protein